MIARLSSVLIVLLLCAAPPLWAEPAARILIVVGPSTHPAGTHEVAAGGRLMKDCLERMTNLPNVEAEVSIGWPRDVALLDSASSIVFIGDTFPPMRLPDSAAIMAKLTEMMKRGCGIACVHYATGLRTEDVAPDGEHPLLHWMGGYFATKCLHHQSVAKIYAKATITAASAEHAICRGWKEFTLNDEPYTNNYFGKESNQPAANVTILATSMLPPEAPKREPVAWCAERADGGRGFGIVMPHFYRNWQLDDLRRFILNGIVWSAKLEVPASGVQTAPPDLKAFAPASIEPLPPKPKQVDTVGPWNLKALKNEVPSMKWLRQDQPVQSLTYTSENYQGHATEVFAFYASPATLGEGKPGAKFPGVVLIHGGGGTAFAEWVQLWARRGYAAIAMDLAGSRPPDPEFDAKGTVKPNANKPESRTRLADGGPNQGGTEKFDSIGGDTSDDWPFHAAASVIHAHTLLRSFPEVDGERTAVTGISWGGYTTCLVASLDDRFKAAVPVYGCGFLHEGESVQKPSIDKLGARAADWVKQYDPGSLLPHCRVPILFVNGTNDVHYPLDSYMKSFAAVPGEKHLRIQVNMPHGHPPGWAPAEIGLFIDSKCAGGKPVPLPNAPQIEGEQVTTTVQSETALRSAELHFTTDEGPRSKRKWTTLPATVTGNNITAPKPPAAANTWFLTVTDERGAMVSSSVQFAK